MANKISIESEKPLGTFYFNHNGSWNQVPSWVEFFVDLGAALACVELERENLVLAVANPTRAFAANLIAMGLVAARSKNIEQACTTDQHFDRICGLKPGTVVQCIEKEKKYRCEFLGIESFSGEQGVKVKIRMPKGQVLRFIPKKLCKDIILSDDSRGIDNATARKIKVIQRPNFTKHFLDTMSPLEFALQQRLECQIIGRQNILALEARYEGFAVKSEDKFEIGSLNDVLRVKDIVRPGDPFRTEIITARNNGHVVDEEYIPRVTIYDGAYGFLKFGSDNKRAIKVVLLDRTEPNFDIASGNIAERFVNKRAREVKLTLNHHLPLSAEVLAFTEGKK